MSNNKDRKVLLFGVELYAYADGCSETRTSFNPDLLKKYGFRFSNMVDVAYLPEEHDEPVSYFCIGDYNGYMEGNPWNHSSIDCVEGHYYWVDSDDNTKSRDWPEIDNAYERNLDSIVYSRKALYDVTHTSDKEATAKLNRAGRRYFNEKFLPMEVKLLHHEVSSWLRVPVIISEGYYDEDDDYNFVELSFKYLEEKYAGEYLTQLPWK